MKTATLMLLAMTIVTGVFYPLAITGVAQLAFPRATNGSLIMKSGRAVGSELIGQPFTDPRYFWSRPSATGPVPYNAGASTGSNLGPLNPALTEAVAARVQALRDADPGNPQPVPVDLVTASASGLDPHISPAAAEYQVARVARARGLDAGQVRRLVAENTAERQLGVLGEPRVNVLALNLAVREYDEGARRTSRKSESP
jgi:K+-transporting ATPase ATPase C chain